MEHGIDTTIPVQFDHEFGHFDRVIEVHDALQSPHGFIELEEAVASGRVVIWGSNNYVYNKGLLRSSQFGIREAAFQDSLVGIGYPENPVGMVVRDLNSRGEPRTSLLVLNGHHRMGMAIITRQPYLIEIVATLDEVEGRFVAREGTDFESYEVLNMYGLMCPPYQLTQTWGFNVIIRAIRDRLME